MIRTCEREGCDKPLPRTAATQRKYCSGRCQRAESRRRATEGLSPTTGSRPTDLTEHTPNTAGGGAS